MDGSPKVAKNLNVAIDTFRDAWSAKRSLASLFGAFAASAFGLFLEEFGQC
jgi:hypothetical protein